MLTYKKGTVFNTPAKTIVNTVNTVGVMGVGLALEFKLRYPEMYKDYKRRCENNEVKVGRPYLYKADNTLWILNFPTKKHWRYDSNLEWIQSGLEYFKNNYKKVDIESIAFPKLGTNNGGLQWQDVKILMEDHLSDLDIDVYICLNEKNEAEGTEKMMLKLINKASSKELTDKVELNKKQANIIIQNQPIERFWNINNFKGIGMKSYSKVFKHYFSKANNDSNFKQLALRFGRYRVP